ncbi:unnamed protein product [Ceutorhynchus assimilis]|uniref:Transcription factor Adf-1 n=1 Tax=Ceutorhynchus assimilis TaxID=467358 RepID=A0A9N9QN79_9CUCU|nr:unnamed protein product [Ceutorhynchus assimilis]
MDERIKSLNFVALVKTHSCLYNVKHESYNRPDIREEAWLEISKIMCESVQTCKERWKNIRTVFLRHLRKTAAYGLVGRNKKKYYLENALQFLLPFLKNSQIQTEKLGVEFDPEHNESNDAAEDSMTPTGEGIEPEFETESQLNETETDPLLNETLTDFRVKREIATRTTLPKRKNSSDAEKSIAEYFDAKRAKLCNPNESADQKFLLSLLPDMELMNASQKRRCKREFLEVIDKILQDNQEQSYP